jgi:hypothetical protein
MPALPCRRCRAIHREKGGGLNPMAACPPILGSVSVTPVTPMIFPALRTSSPSVTPAACYRCWLSPKSLFFDACYRCDRLETVTENL